jgi:D-alanyl-D-alanine carboxypeptidase/D-alanyl-D-alanine-endopeptidase (penicillin-binding protein 4)
MQGQFLSGFVTVILSFSVWAQDSGLSGRVSKVLERSGIKKSNLGLVIANAEGDIVYAHNYQQAMMPASLTKIVTAAAALEKFPVGHQFLTEIKANHKLIGESTLTGPLCLLGGGDPGFVSESMWFLVNEFTRTQITQVEGDIWVDDTKFDNVRFDPSRDQARVDRAYDSPIGAMTFNWSALNVYVRPGKRAGQPAVVIADPVSDYIKIINKARTIISGKTKIQVEHKGLSADKKTETIEVTGQIALDATEFVAYKSVVQPDIWAGIQLKQFLKQRGISVTGQVKAAACGADMRTLASYKSRPVGDLVVSLMKFSNNYIAEILTKNLSVQERGGVGTMPKGIQVLRDYMKEHKFSEGAVLENPSGLSRSNRFAAADLLKILLHVKNNFRLFPEYFSSLPIAGVDGTLKKRLSADNQLGQVRAKTGHLSGVSGLGGYASDKAGHIYSFVFLFNGSADDGYKSKDLYDRLLEQITNN